MNPQANGQAEQSASTDVQDRARRRLAEREEEMDRRDRLEQLRRYFARPRPALTDGSYYLYPYELEVGWPLGGTVESD